MSVPQVSSDSFGITWSNSDRVSSCRRLLMNMTAFQAISIEERRLPMMFAPGV